MQRHTNSHLPSSCTYFSPLSLSSPPSPPPLPWFFLSCSFFFPPSLFSYSRLGSFFTIRHLSPSLWPLFSLKAPDDAPAQDFFIRCKKILSASLSLPSSRSSSLPNLLFILLSTPSLGFLSFSLLLPFFSCVVHDVHTLFHHASFFDLYFTLPRNLHRILRTHTHTEITRAAKIFASWHRIARRPFNVGIKRRDLWDRGPRSGQKARVNEFGHCFTRV